MTKPTKKPNEKILYIGDNLPIMLGMESGMVDLIYTDPPFNSSTFRKGKTDSHSFNDTWSDKQVDYAHAVALKFQYPNIWDLIVMAGKMHSPAMQHYLEFMAPRIVQMHRLLKPTGSLYLHCDPTASHYLKLILDNVFNRNNFRNEIIWRKYGGRKNNATKKFSTQQDVIFLYGKSENALFKPLYIPHSVEEIAKKYNHTDNDGRKYRLVWGRKFQLSGEQRKIYLDESKGRALGTLWVEKGLQLNTSTKERTGYATQKPIALLDRIIKASSNEGDLIMDPFCGCATACVSAAGLNRRWIGIDQNDEAPQILNDRLGGQYFTADYQTNMPTETKAKRQKTIKLPQRQVTGYKKLSKAKGKLNLLQRDYKNPGFTYCRGCFDKLDEKHLTVDHILAQDKGGLDELENYQLMCTTCNSRKGNNDMEFLFQRIDADTRQQRLDSQAGR